MEFLCCPEPGKNSIRARRRVVYNVVVTHGTPNFHSISSRQLTLGLPFHSLSGYPLPFNNYDRNINYLPQHLFVVRHLTFPRNLYKSRAHFLRRIPPAVRYKFNFQPPTRVNHYYARLYTTVYV